MFKTLLLSGLVLTGLIATASEAQAYYPRYGGYRSYYPAPYYGYRYHAGPTAGYAVGYSGYGPYYNYGYRYYNYAPVVYPTYPVYSAYPGYYSNPGYYYGPRLGVRYVSPRVGVYVGY